MIRSILLACTLSLTFFIGAYVGDTTANRECYARYSDLLE